MLGRTLTAVTFSSCFVKSCLEESHQEDIDEGGRGVGEGKGYHSLAYRKKRRSRLPCHPWESPLVVPLIQALIQTQPSHCFWECPSVGQGHSLPIARLSSPALSWSDSVTFPLHERQMVIKKLQHCLECVLPALGDGNCFVLCCCNP